MRKTILVFLSSICVAALHAADLTVSLAESGGPKKKEYRVQARSKGGLALVIENSTQYDVTVTHVGIGNTALLIRVEDTVVKAADEASIPVFVDNESLGVPGGVEIAIGYISRKEFRTVHTTVTVGATDLVTFTPGFLTWKVGEELIEKYATVKLPMDFKLSRTPTAEGFEIRVEGDRILVKPSRTDKARTAGVMLETVPAVSSKRLVPLVLTVAN